MPSGKPGTLTHGYSAYFGNRCRCDICRTAASDWKRQRYGYRTLAEYRADVDPPHGTESRYTGSHKCRRARCRKASRDARQRRRSAARG